jgi:hypothetical protein
MSKIKNKQLLVLISILAFAMVFAACGTSSDTSTPDEAPDAAAEAGEPAATEKQYTPAEGFDAADGIYVKAESKYYWEGRYSNGRVFSEYIAKALAGDYEALENYAVGGAFSGILTGSKEDGTDRSNWSPWLKGWGGIEQTETFLADYDGKAPAGGLYIISTGGNDEYTAPELGEDKAVDASVKNIETMINNLAEAGATDFLVMLLSTKPGQEASSFTKLHREKLSSGLEAYAKAHAELNVIVTDPEVLYKDMADKGEEAYGYKSWGFSLISDWVPAYGYAWVKDDNTDKLPSNKDEDIYGYGYTYSTDSKYYAPETADYATDDFLYYDEYHLSSRSQKHLASYLLNKDIEADDGTFGAVYDGDPSAFAASDLAKKTYEKIYTFGDSGIDCGRALAVTTALVQARK